MGMSFPDGYGFGLVVPMGFIPVDIPIQNCICTASRQSEFHSSIAGNFEDCRLDSKKFWTSTGHFHDI
jgi:hypothetical protein